ncbi:hypothetical protein DXG01_014787 [Tephrocybe rancida]|nr:hypothetical protein DXG01_014787 [Tephrocybe rancida]
MDHDDQDSSHPSAYPSSLYNVNKCFRRTALGVPELWTRLIVFVGSSSTPLDHLEQQLQASSHRNMLLDITLTRHQDDIDEDEDMMQDMMLVDQPVSRQNDLHSSMHNEKACVLDVMDVLRPHLRRCEKLSFDLLFKSSLPWLLCDIGSLPVLRLLLLTAKNCDDNACDYILFAVERERAALPLVLPNLSVLEIDGPNYGTACGRGVEWLKSVSDIEIAHISMADAECLRLPLVKAIKPLQHVNRLVLCDVDFPHNADWNPEDRMLFDNLDELVLADLSAEFVLNFSLLTKFSDRLSKLVVDHCSLGPLAGLRHQNIIELELKNIDEDPFCFLSHWEGCDLLIESCAGFGDAFVHAMYSFILSKQTEAPGKAPFAHLEKLKIIHCPNLSYDGFVHLLRVIAFAQPHKRQIHGFHAPRTLSIPACYCPNHDHTYTYPRTTSVCIHEQKA